MIRKFTFKAVTLCVVSLLLNACAFMPDNWAFQEEIIKTDELERIKRVALLDVPQPSYIWLGQPDSATAGFINPLISLAVSTHEGDTITNSAYISETTRNELRNWLEQAGKEVTLLDAERENKSKMLENYEQFSEVDADAILEVAPINIGFRPETGFGSKVSPGASFAYRLVLVKNGEIIIESNVTYSSFPGAHGSMKGVNLLGPEEFIYEDEDAVKEDPEEAIRRLKYSILATTKLISEIVTNGRRAEVAGELAEADRKRAEADEKLAEADRKRAEANRIRALHKYPFNTNWLTERVVSSGSLYPFSLTIIDEKSARYRSARADSRGRIIFTSIGSEGRWEGYWIGSKPANVCLENREGSRNWGLVIWEFDETYSRFKGTWDYCGEGRKYLWNGRR
jgi:hypothetical protein